MGHHSDDQFAEGLAIGLLLGSPSRRRRPPRPTSGSGCADAWGRPVAAVLVAVVASLAVHLWFVTVPAVVTWVMVRRRRRRAGNPARRDG